MSKTKKEHLLELIPDIEYDLPLKKLNLILEAMDNYTEQRLSTSKVDRVEVIDNNGRSYVNWDKSNRVSVQMQDNDKTLKIFIK